MLIGIFDSGRGGEIMAIELKLILPNFEFLVANDRENVPYGTRTNDQIIQLTEIAIQPLIKAGCTIIVIACNTATMASIAHLRANYPHVMFIGVEPMIKTASEQSKTRHITVLATPLTLSSQRYKDLRDKFAEDLIIDQPNTVGWASSIERNRSDELNYSELIESIQGGSDTVVLACTHYHHIKNPIRQLIGANVTILEPTEAIARQIVRLAEV